MQVFDPTKITPVETTTFRFNFGRCPRNVGHDGHIGYIAGKPGSGKTWFSYYLQAAALSGRTILNFEFDLRGRNVISVDPEQPPELWEEGQMRLLHAAGLPTAYRHPQHFAFNFAGYSYQQKQEMLFDVIKQHRKNIGLLVVDRVDAFISDANDRESAFDFIAKLEWTALASECVVIVNSHLNESKHYESLRPYGALGVAIDKIASFGFITSRWGPAYQLSIKKGRYGPVPPIRARITDNGDIAYFVAEPFMPW